jgi:hypothetical protein
MSRYACMSVRVHVWKPRLYAAVLLFILRFRRGRVHRFQIDKLLNFSARPFGPRSVALPLVRCTCNIFNVALCVDKFLKLPARPFGPRFAALLLVRCTLNIFNVALCVYLCTSVGVEARYKFFAASRRLTHNSVVYGPICMRQSVT